MREALIQELRRLHTETDQTPTQALMAGQGAYDPELYRHEFGSWEAALREANLDPEALDEERYDHIDELPSDIADTIHDLLDSNDPQRFYRGQLLAELNRLAVELGETPSLPKMKNYGRYSGSSYRNYFGSWNEAVETLGYPPNTRTKRIPEVELLEEVRRLAEELDRRPRTTDLERHGNYALPTYYNRFDTWEEVCRKAGLDE